MHQFIDQLTFNLMVVEFISTESATLNDIRIKHVNQGAARLLGYSAQDLSNQTLSVITSPDIVADYWPVQLLNSKLKDRENTFACELITAANSRISVQVSASLLPDAGPADNQLILIIQKISTLNPPDKTLSMMHIAVEQSASAVMITDHRGRIEYVNPKFTELTGYSTKELLGNNPRLLQSGHTTPEYYQAMWSLLQETGEWKGEIRNKKKNGQYYWAYESISAIKNDQGETTHFLAVEEDISARKQAESALTESEQRFRQMAAMTGEWLWEQDPQGYYIYSSSAVKDILGLQPDEIVGRHYTELLTAQDKQQLQPNANINEPFYSLINHYRHKDGHLIFVESTGLPIKDSHGKLIKWRGVDHDITARKHFQDQLIESEQRKRLIVESALNAIVIMDSYGIITDWNNQAEKMFGWQREQAIGHRVDEMIIPPRFRQAHRQGLKTFLHTGQGPIINQLIEHIAVRRDGSEFPVELSIAPLKLGNAYIFSGFIHDITTRKASERQIRQAEVNLAIARNEMKIAHRIQASLLPAAPLATAEIEVTGACLPAAQVGGDYFDYFYRDENHLDMVIADVSGHSIGPALFMVETRSALRTQANWLETPAQTLAILNSFLFQDLNNADYFITMFYLQYDVAAEQLSFANAGHPSPLLLRHQQKQCSKLDADGLILGVRKEIQFEEKTLALNSGDMLLLYTDGITEAENPEGEFFGLARLCDHFSQLAHLQPRAIIDQIMTQLKQFSQTESFNDDVTMMIFKRR